jgi:hypothetical protein
MPKTIAETSGTVGKPRKQGDDGKLEFLNKVDQLARLVASRRGDDATALALALQIVSELPTMHKNFV